MGLDMYAFATTADITEEVDFEIEDEEMQNTDEIAYWRKHPDLHGWMKKLYRAKGGKREFNCVNVALTLEDLDLLEADIEKRNLPKTDGFFFGESRYSDEAVRYDMEFVASARAAIAEGRKVYYTSWW